MTSRILSRFALVAGMITLFGAAPALAGQASLVPHDENNSGPSFVSASRIAQSPAPASGIQAGGLVLHDESNSGPYMVRTQYMSASNHQLATSHRPSLRLRSESMSSPEFDIH